MPKALKKTRRLKYAALAGGAIALLAGITFCVFHKSENEQEAEAFATESATAISQNWDYSELVTRAEPGLVAAMDSQGQSVTDLFGIYRGIGARKSDERCKIKDMEHSGTETQSYVSASYNCTADFESGPATIFLTVRKNEGQRWWRIYYIRISTPADS